MEQEIRILDAVPEDAEGITNVLYKSWLNTYPNTELGITVEDIEESYKEAFTEEKIRNQQQRIANIPKNQKRLVAKYGDLIVGVATIVKNEDCNQLRTIYILPEFQGKGIGKMLWNEAKKFCDPTKDTVVQVATFTQDAIEFYKKLGFVDNGKRSVGEKMRNGAVITEMEMEIKAI